MIRTCTQFVGAVLAEKYEPLCTEFIKNFKSPNQGQVKYTVWMPMKPSPHVILALSLLYSFQCGKTKINVHLECPRNYGIIEWDNQTLHWQCACLYFFTHFFIKFGSTNFQEEPVVHQHYVVTQILHFSCYRTEYIRD